MVVPAEFAGIIPVSPAEADFAFEPEAFLALRACIAEGAEVLDVGASFGVMTSLMAKIGAGHIWSMEPNPEALALGQLLASANQIEQRVEFRNTLAGEAPQEGVDFWQVPGFLSVASTRNPEIRLFHPDATKRSLPMIALDDLKLTQPSVIKIDVEGSEYQVLRGAKRVLAEFSPDLVIETHGLEINGIGGDLQALCGMLNASGYQLWDLKTSSAMSPAGYATTYREASGQLLASKRLHRLALA